MELAAQLPDTRITCVMDREADFFELFDAHREHPGVDLLIRASHNRHTDAGKLFDRLRTSTVQGQMQLAVNGKVRRPKRSKQKARPARMQRLDQLDLHYEQVEFVARPAGMETQEQAQTLGGCMCKRPSPLRGSSR